MVETCPGKPTTKYMRAQLERLNNQQFPGEQNMALGPFRQPTEEEVDWLARYNRASQSADAEIKAAVKQQEVFRQLGGGELLREFGILNPEDMQAWKEAAAARRKREVEKDPLGSSSEDE